MTAVTTTITKDKLTTGYYLVHDRDDRMGGCDPFRQTRIVHVHCPPPPLDERIQIHETGRTADCRFEWYDWIQKLDLATLSDVPSPPTPVEQVPRRRCAKTPDGERSAIALWLETYDFTGLTHEEIAELIREGAHEPEVDIELTVADLYDQLVCECVKPQAVLRIALVEPDNDLSTEFAIDEIRNHDDVVWLVGYVKKKED